MLEPVIQRFGGAKGVSRLAFRFHDLVLASDRLQQHFESIDMPRLIEHQVAFIVTVLGGRLSWSQEELAAMHAHLELGEAELDEMAALLALAIAAEGYPESEAERVLQQFRRMRGCFLGLVGGGSELTA
jgi:hemoglobin